MKKNLLYFLQSVDKNLAALGTPYSTIDVLTKGCWLMAHLVCESGWGISGLTADTQNYFGIKWVKSSTYPKSEKAYWDNAIKDYSYYEVHGNLEESIKAFFAFLNRNKSRYRNLVRGFESDSNSNLWHAHLSMSGLTNEMAKAGYFESWCRPFNHWDIVRTVLRRDRGEGYQGLKYILQKLDKTSPLHAFTPENLHLKLDDHAITQAILNLDLVCSQLLDENDFHQPSKDMTVVFKSTYQDFHKQESSEMLAKIKCRLIEIRTGNFSKWQLMMRGSTEVDCMNHFFHGIYYAKWIPQTIRDCFPFHSYKPGSNIRDVSLSEDCSCDEEEKILRPKLSVNAKGGSNNDSKEKRVIRKDTPVVLTKQEEEVKLKKKNESILPIEVEIETTDKVLAEDVDEPLTQEIIENLTVKYEAESNVTNPTSYIPMGDVFANRQAGSKSRYIN